MVCTTRSKSRGKTKEQNREEDGRSKEDESCGEFGEDGEGDLDNSVSNETPRR